VESSGSYRSRWLTAGGILSIVAGAFEIIGGGAMVALAVSPAVRYALLGVPYVPIIPNLVDPTVRWLIIIGALLLVLGTVAVAGGVSAVRRKDFGLSLAGAVCALPSVIFGLALAGIFPTFPALDLVTNGLLRLPGRIFCALPSAILGILAVVFVAVGKREFEAKAGSDSHRGGLVTAGGILSTIVGAFEIVGGGGMVGSALSPAIRDTLLVPFYSSGPAVDLWAIYGMPTRLIAEGVPLLVLGAIAVAGGVSAMRRKSFGLSMAGAVCALPSVIFGLSLAGAFPALDRLMLFVPLSGRIFFAFPSVILGILAVIFVALGKREFGAERKENEV
jgi:hypothetical protein